MRIGMRLLLGYFLIVAIAAKKEKEIARTFESLERIWDEYNVYEKQVPGNDQ